MKLHPGQPVVGEEQMICRHCNKTDRTERTCYILHPELAEVAKATSKPINALAAGPFAKVSCAEYAAAGIARISLGSALARVTHAAIRDAAQAMFGNGDFSPLTKVMPGSDVDALLARFGDS